MSRYETYKPSGIDWIGDFPSHWDFNRLKNLCTVNKEVLTEKTPFNYLIEYIDIGNTNDKGEFIEVQELEFSEAPSRARRKVEGGDTIISTVRTYLRAIAFIENPKENLIVSTGFAVLNSNKQRLLPKFLFYQVLCDSFIQRVIANSEGVSYPAISSTKLSDLKLFIPPTDEQLTIANYLDDQTQKIDRLIANKKAQAEKLKELRQIEINNAVTKGLNRDFRDLPDDLDKNNSKNQENPAIKPIKVKDSGIDWLGKIPKHWEVKRLKNVATKITDGEHIAPNFTDSGMPFLSAKDIRENEILFEEDKFVSLYDGRKFRQRCNPEIDDILIVSRGATVGRVNIVNTDREFCLLGSVILIKPVSIINSKFLYYALTNPKIQENLFMTSQSSAQQAIYLVNISLLKLAIAPIEEQIQIANYLQQRTTAIDQLIKNVEAQIEKLQELRKIKIYEAVTGKIKVSEP